jgi:hypothetical protein
MDEARLRNGCCTAVATESGQGARGQGECRRGCGDESDPGGCGGAKAKAKAKDVDGFEV